MRISDKLNSTRFDVIRDLVSDAKQESGLELKDIFFELYDARLITGAELDMLMSKIIF